MDRFDRELEHFPSPAVSPPGRHLFGKMVIASFLLHAISTAILLTPRTTSTSSPAVSYIDLKEMKFAEPEPALPEIQDEEEPLSVPEESTVPSLSPPPPCRKWSSCRKRRSSHVTRGARIRKPSTRDRSRLG